MLGGNTQPTDALRDDTVRQIYHYQGYEWDTVLIKATAPELHSAVSRERPNSASAVSFSVFGLFNAQALSSPLVARSALPRHVPSYGSIVPVL